MKKGRSYCFVVRVNEGEWHGVAVIPWLGGRNTGGLLPLLLGCLLGVIERTQKPRMKKKEKKKKKKKKKTKKKKKKKRAKNWEQVEQSSDNRCVLTCTHYWFFTITSSDGHPFLIQTLAFLNFGQKCYLNIILTRVWWMNRPTDGQTLL